MNWRQVYLNFSLIVTLFLGVGWTWPAPQTGPYKRMNPLTYDDFERIGMELGAPYALCKIAWEYRPILQLPWGTSRDTDALYVFWRKVLEKFPPEAMEPLKFLSSFEVEPGTWEEIVRRAP